MGKPRATAPRGNHRKSSSQNTAPADKKRSEATTAVPRPKAESPGAHSGGACPKPALRGGRGVLTCRMAARRAGGRARTRRPPAPWQGEPRTAERHGRPNSPTTFRYGWHTRRPRGRDISQAGMTRRTPPTGAALATRRPSRGEGAQPRRGRRDKDGR